MPQGLPIQAFPWRYHGHYTRQLCRLETNCFPLNDTGLCISRKNGVAYLAPDLDQVLGCASDMSLKMLMSPWSTGPLSFAEMSWVSFRKSIWTTLLTVMDEKGITHSRNGATPLALGRIQTRLATFSANNIFTVSVSQALMDLSSMLNRHTPQPRGESWYLVSSVLSNHPSM